jgi:hypothetical protein
MNIYNFYTQLILLGGLIVLITSIWVCYDSNLNKIPITHKPYSINNGSTAWFLSCLLLWPFTFPYYFVKRSDTLHKRKFDKYDIDKSIENLKKYKQLLDEGIIDENDYMKKKQEFI